jgi:hypothetical protein
VELPPEHAQELRHIAEEDLGPLNDCMAGRAEGDQEVERRDTGLAVMDGEDRIYRRRLAALAGVTVPLQDPFAQAGELPFVRSHPAIAALAETARPDRARPAAAEEHPLPGTRLSWHQLYAQFGKDPSMASDKETVNDFRKEVLRELKKLRLCWPSLDYGTPKGFLEIRGCAPSVAPKQIAANGHRAL